MCSCDLHEVLSFEFFVIRKLFARNSVKKSRDLYGFYGNFEFFLENENNELETLVRLLHDEHSEHVDGEQSRDGEQDVKEEYIKIEVSD